MRGLLGCAAARVARRCKSARGAPLPKRRDRHPKADPGQVILGSTMGSTFVSTVVCTVSPSVEPPQPVPIGVSRCLVINAVDSNECGGVPTISDSVHVRTHDTPAHRLQLSAPRAIPIPRERWQPVTLGTHTRHTLRPGSHLVLPERLRASCPFLVHASFYA